MTVRSFDVVDGGSCGTCGRPLPAGALVCPACANSPTLEMAVGSAGRGGPPRIEGYRVLRMLGAGGMGTVYLGEDCILGRRVAIKLISSQQANDDAARARFLREARVMATVEHPHIVRLYAFGASAGIVYLVMEYVEGESLADRLARLGRLPVEEALQLVQQIAQALEAAAEHGIIHRDIKPANILLDRRDRVRVADFGLAKAAGTATEEAAVTQTGLVVGTPHYLSPEQARGEDVDLRSDIYSLGILLYALLTGAPPFRGPTPAAILADQIHTPVPGLRETMPQLPEGVVRLVSRMTRKAPSERHASYQELRREIEESLAPVARWTSGSPFRGLAPFDLAHAPVFFGRARAVEDVLDALRAQAASGCAFVVVLGMSGSGKSSLLRAGVLPRLLQEGVLEGVQAWRHAILRPADFSGDLFDGLAAALMRDGALPELAADGTTDRQLAELLRETPRAAAPLVKGALSQAAAELRREKGLRDQPDVRLVIAVDQLEELFTLERISPQERSGFVDALAVLARSGRVAVLATLRSDYYARCEEVPQLMSLKAGAGQYHVRSPTTAEITQMIRQPAHAAGLHFEEEPHTQSSLDDVLRDAAVGQPGSLPLLQFTLDELYQQRTREGILSFSIYRALGGLEGALGRRAESVFAALPPQVQAALAEVLPALVRVGSRDQGPSRRQASLGAFASPESRALVDALVAARLFITDRGDDEAAVVSIAHDALLRSWPRLRSWLERNEELLRIRERVGLAATQWAANGKPGDLLLAEGKPLEEALPLITVKGLDLSSGERQLIEASDARARGRRRARWMMNANGVALLIGGVAACTFWLWKVLPQVASTYAGQDKVLPLSTRFVIASSNYFIKWLLPLLVAASPLLYLARRRLKYPEFVRSGMALAVASGLALLLLLLVLLVAMSDLASLLPISFTTPAKR